MPIRGTSRQSTKQSKRSTGTVDGAVRTRSPRDPDIVLSIGTPTTMTAKRSAFCCGTQWVAALDQTLDHAGEGILGCLYGATIGAAQVLLHALDLAGASYRPHAAALLQPARSQLDSS